MAETLGWGITERLETKGAEMEARATKNDHLQAEVERLTQWVNDLQADTYVTCVYCGYNYGPDDEVPTSIAEVLEEHIESCPKHPMSELKRRVDKALVIAEDGIIDGGHHKMWVIDQMVRVLLGDDYEKWLASSEDEWDTGIVP